MTTIAALPPVTSNRLADWIARNGPVLAIFAAVFALWEAAVRALDIPDYILPSPSVIAAKIIASWQLLLLNAFVTLEEILLGFALSVIVAIPLAIAVVYSRIFERTAFPFMVSLQTIPKVALAPILVMWLGYGIMPKVMVAFLISFFPIVINAVIGMRSAEKEVIYLVQSMGASELTTFLKIRLPKALPSIFGGLKVGMGQAVVGATVGEFIAAERNRSRNRGRRIRVDRRTQRLRQEHLDDAHFRPDPSDIGADGGGRGGGKGRGRQCRRRLSARRPLGLAHGAGERAVAGRDQ